MSHTEGMITVTKEDASLTLERTGERVSVRVMEAESPVEAFEVDVEAFDHRRPYSVGKVRLVAAEPAGFMRLTVYTDLRAVAFTCFVEAKELDALLSV